MTARWLAIGTALALVCGRAAAEPVTPAMFGALPTVSAAEISSDGKTVAQIQSKDGIRAVAFYDVDGEKAPIGVQLGTVKARGLRWAGPDHVLVLVSASMDVAWGHGIQSLEIWRWVSINRNDGATAFLFRTYTNGYYNFGSGKLLSPVEGSPDSVVMAQWMPTNTLYRVNLSSGDDRLIERGRSETVRWVVSPGGTPVVRIDYFHRLDQLRFYRPDKPGGRFLEKSVITQKLEDELEVTPLASAGADNLVASIMRDNGLWSLCTFDADRGEKTGCDAPEGFDIEDGVLDFPAGRVVGFTYADEMPRVKFTDADLASVQQSIERALPGAAPRITSWSNDRQMFMVWVEYPDHPPQIFLFNRRTRSLKMWAATYEGLDGKAFAVREPYEYAASDGLRIPGYLTLPAGAARKDMPLIVIPHGGPEARDTQAFDWWAYFYAARGYAVYQPNFRGSYGYGEAFRKAGFLEWGKKMQDDVTEGVRKLIDSGVADANRVCIVGASYGGYSALVGATLTPDLYACAVSVAGVSSLPAMIAYETDRGVHEDAWDVRIGARVSDNAALRAVSPYYQAARATAPIMLIHGKDDIIVPFDQSTLMRDALLKAGKRFEFVELPSEDHWLSSGETRTEMLAKSIEFIDKYIGGNAPAN